MCHCFTLSLVVCVLLSQFFTAAAVGGDVTVKAFKLRNVELNADGVLTGQLIDRTGAGFPVGTLSVASRDVVLALSTDRTGRFAVAGLRGGLCMFRADGHDFSCRIWAHGTAPPDSVRTVALVVEQDSVIRGNRTTRSVRGCPDECDCQDNRILSSDAKYGLGILALGGTAAYFALSRDNASD